MSSQITKIAESPEEKSNDLVLKALSNLDGSGMAYDYVGYYSRYIHFGNSEVISLCVECDWTTLHREYPY